MIDRNQIPPSWEVVKLGEVCVFEYGKGLTKENRDENGKINVYGSNGVVGKHSSFLIDEPCLIVGRKGAAGEVHLSLEPCYPIDTTYFVRKPKLYDLKYFFYCLKNMRLASLEKSTAIPGLNRNDAYAKEIPLPPFPEQQRIVSKIEELFSELDKGIESLKTAQQQLKVYRQAVLKWAFEGKLTNKKVKDGELPEGWKWMKLGEKGKLVSGQHILEKDYNFSKSGIPYFTGPADFGNYFPSVSKWTIHPKAIAKKNDVLITVKGAGVGKINLMYIEEAAISRQLMAFSSSEIDSKYIYHFLSSKFHDFQRLGLGSTVPGIDRDTILNYQITLCKLEEQKQIVQEIETRLSVCDKLEETITHSLQQSEALRQSILKKAFEGKLVAQNPKDEPASKMLERIKAESAKAR